MLDRKSYIGIIVALAFTFSIGCVQAQNSAAIKNINPAQAKQMLEKGEFDLVLDVRTMGEYTGSTGHIAGAKLLPVDQLPSALESLAPYKDKKILVYCHSGNRSAQGTAFLDSSGFSGVFNLSGGITGWKENGFATEHKASSN